MTLKLSTTTFHRTQTSVTIPAVLRSRSIAARNVPVVAGLCLPKGRLTTAAIGHVAGFEANIAAQFEVLNRWHDGSVRWLLTSLIAPEVSSHGCELSVVALCEKQSQKSPASNCVTTMKSIPSEIQVITRDTINDSPVERTLRLTPCLRDISGAELPLQIDRIREEVNGAIRQVCVVAVRIPSVPFVTLQLRLTHWASAGLLHVETRLRNTRRAKHVGGLWDLGDAGSFLFCSLEIAVASDEISANAATHWKAEPDHSLCSTSSDIRLLQFDSGGPFWNSANHVTASGQIDVPGRGYEVTTDSHSTQGNRAEPTFLVEGDSSFLAAAVPEFWQQSPGSIATATGILEVGLFPALPPVTYELQGGEQKTLSFWLATGPGKGNINGLDWVHDAPRLLQSAPSIADAKVFPWFGGHRRVGPAATPRRPTDGGTVIADATSRLADYLHDATSGDFSLEARRDSIDEYGWRNFGDVPADHEQTHYAGSKTIVSHYNNQFDMIFGSILQLASTSDLKWFDMLDPLARHVMDIDIYHTNEDRAAFNGGLFWHTDHYVDAHSSTHRTYSRKNQKPGQPYGGGPGCEHNYTTGLLHYYYLTGNPEARESVLSLADWVIQMDDGRNTVFGLLDNGPTGAASATVSENFHGPGRGAGNSMNALLDAWLLTNAGHYLHKLEELIRRCVHPRQDPDDLHLLDAEDHWSYTVFLSSLGRYLLAKRDAEMFDAMYSYSRDVMKTYGRWMATNERRTLDRPEELQYPTEAWAAQDFRKANVLRIASSCEDDVSHAVAMRTRANAISEAAWKDMSAFGPARLNARCLSILMTEGHRDIFHRTCEPMLIPACPATYDVGPWSMFVPQKQRIKKLMHSPRRLIEASIGVFSPDRLISAWRALRRQI